MSYIPPQIPANTSYANPTLKDLLDSLKTDIAMAINCHAIATVTSFSQDPTTNRFVISATMNYQKTYWTQNLDGTYIAKLVDYPMIVDAPAIVLGGGSTALTFPIQAGDQCLILFNDRDLNNWFAGAQSGPVATARMHSFADAIALVGFQKVASYDASHALLSNASGAKLGINASAGTVLIANNTTNLNDILSTLVTDLNVFAAGVQNACASGPVSPALLSSAAAGLTSNLVAFTAKITALLES